MMPVGLILSGLLVRAAEMLVARDVALLAPFLIAALGALVLGYVGWHRLGQGFAAPDTALTADPRP